jgi:hypothetical protein
MPYSIRERLGLRWRRVSERLLAMTSLLPWRGVPPVIEPPEAHDPPPAPEHDDPTHAHGDPELDPQQHVDSVPPLERGHPKR